MVGVRKVHDQAQGDGEQDHDEAQGDGVHDQEGEDVMIQHCQYDEEMIRRIVNVPKKMEDTMKTKKMMVHDEQSQSQTSAPVSTCYT